jgi:hypothetical protein
VTSRRMLKVAWNGEKLSTDEKDGGWESGYEWTPGEKALADASTRDLRSNMSRL